MLRVLLVVRFPTWIWSLSWPPWIRTRTVFQGPGPQHPDIEANPFPFLRSPSCPCSSMSCIRVHEETQRHPVPMADRSSQESWICTLYLLPLSRAPRPRPHLPRPWCVLPRPWCVMPLPRLPRPWRNSSAIWRKACARCCAHALVQLQCVGLAFVLYLMRDLLAQPH